MTASCLTVSVSQRKLVQPEFQPTTNLEEALRQLRAMGHLPSDRIVVRALPPKNVPLEELLKRKMAFLGEGGRIVKLPVKGYIELGKRGFSFTRIFSDRSGKKPRFFKDGFAELSRLNAMGYGIYLVVNFGYPIPVEARSLFYEVDSVTKTEQWQRLRKLEAKLGQKASQVIKTRNSLHVYFFLDELISLETWQQYQERLIQTQDSDPCIRDYPRLMRLAGFNHVKWNETPSDFIFSPVTIVQQEETTFALEDFDRTLEPWDGERWRRHRADEIKVTDASDNPWDIRNFAHYLPGHEPMGREAGVPKSDDAPSGTEGYTTCKCPAHNGESLDSLHIDNATGSFKCWGGCESKAIYQAARQIAVASGHQFPKGFSGERTEAQERMRHIQKRKMAFLQFWEFLKADFLLSETEGRKLNRYSGRTPVFEVCRATELIQGWLGAGKTEAVLRSLLKHKGKQILWLSPRNGLLRQIENRAKQMGVEVYHYQDDVAFLRDMLRVGEPGIFFMAPDSLKAYAVGECNWDNTIVVVDEFAGVRKEVLVKSAIMPQFERLITECQTLIAADAFLSDADCRIISAYRGKDREILFQTFEKSKTPVYWLDKIGKDGKDGKISMTHEGVSLKVLEAWVEEGVKSIAIASDNLLIAKVCQRYLESRGVASRLVCSETPETNAPFMDDPDGCIEDEAIDSVIATPTIQSGVDIQSRFEKGLLIATGVLAPTQMLQLMGRFRRCQEWYVSASRRNQNPAVTVPSLEGSKVKKWSKQLSQTFAELEFLQANKTIGWGLWDRLTREIETAFNSEYLQCLLEHYFESVETVEVEGVEIQQWRSDVAEVKRQDAKDVLGADLEHGQELRALNKQPATRKGVFDVKLAELHEKYPPVVTELMKAHERRDEGALDLALLFLNSRLERLRYWVIAMEDNPQDTEDLLQSMRDRFVCYNSTRFKAYQYISLFNRLNLNSLAQCSKGRKVPKKDVTHFSMQSDAIVKRWKRFIQDKKLLALFPVTRSLKDFWAIVQKCMSFMGYESAGANIRVDSDKPCPNGKDRKGNQRYSRSRSVYFSAWTLMEESGSALFREMFPEIIEAIQQRIQAERAKRSERLNSSIPRSGGEKAA